MRKYYALVMLVLLPTLGMSQNKLFELFDNLDANDLETGILYNPGFSFVDLINDKNIYYSSNDFIQAYNELADADLHSTYPDDPGFKSLIKESFNHSIVPIGLLMTEFEIIQPTALTDGRITASNQKLHINAVDRNSIFDKKSRLIAAPLRNQLRGNQVVFSITENLIWNATDVALNHLEIDFGNGEGFKRINIGANVAVNYLRSGEHDLGFRLTLGDGRVFTSHSKLIITEEGQNFQRGSRGPSIPFTSSITPDLSLYGEPTNYPGQGEYQIFPDTVDGILDKPIILVDGFDPGDGRTIDGLYSLLNYTDSMGSQNLADLVRGQGFDVVILNFPVYTRAADMAIIDGGADFIERNAMLLVDLINTINADKVGDEEVVIIGPSMGGLISRFALNYMENQSLDHQTRLFLSFDSPHRGANVPIGLQHQLNYLAYGLDGNSVVDLQPLIDEFLKSAAARQMLVDHFESHLMSGSNVEFDTNPAFLTPIAHPWKAIFDTSINGLTLDGFPQNVRNAAIINGSGVGNRYQDKLGADINPGFTLIDDTFDVALSTTADLTINYTPATAAGIQPVSEILVVFTLIFPVTLYDVTANAQAFSYSDGVDAGSGGLFNLGSLTADLPPTGITADFVNALRSDFFNFIPSVSGIALEITSNGEIDWYHDINIGTGSPPTLAPGDVVDNTPFVNWYLPDNNEEHVELTESNVAFALSEIIPETLSSGSTELTSIRLEKNPIQDELGILLNKPLSKVDLYIYDLMGRQVVKRSLGNLLENVNVRLDLASGIYVIQLNATEGKYTTKLVVD
ncbi:MAG: T9SS type A sorting domain-containing protein [Flavobacteriaceae bacterium]|nr:T9SS type A sorting domain-containing protein [Flavobacteriaceae bacterium]